MAEYSLSCTDPYLPLAQPTPQSIWLFMFVCILVRALRLLVYAIIVFDCCAPMHLRTTLVNHACAILLALPESPRKRWTITCVTLPSYEVCWLALSELLVSVFVCWFLCLFLRLLVECFFARGSVCFLVHCPSSDTS